MNLNEKVVIVSGASRGIGRAIAEILSMHGAIVIGTSTTDVGVTEINDLLKDNGKGMKLDVSNKCSIAALFKKIKLEFNNVDILINNAGIVRDNIIVNMHDREWHDVISTNLTSVYYMSKYAMRFMLKKRYGRIINISSMVGFMGNQGQTNYSASKSGLIGFSKSLAREVASRGITVNTIAPGFISTDMIDHLTEEYRLSILSKIPVGRFGTPRDVAYAALFLSSNEAGYITGETIHVNGGMYML